MRVVGYVRLSRDDGNDESVSIGTQKKIIRRYAEENNMVISEFYEDDGVSGYTFDRPAFNRLKKDLFEGTVDIIIAKDLSRLGRHNAKTLLFIEEVTKLDKEVILISDEYSNLRSDDDMIGIKTWFNERHVKDTSKKVRNAISVLQEEGSWINSVPIGYRRIYTKKNGFEIDPEGAAVVRRIFDMYVNGMGSRAIARELTKEGVPTPTQFQNMARELYDLPPLPNTANEWSMRAIRRLLENEFYIGTLVLRKTKTIGINGKKIERNEAEHIKFPNHHDPIIDNETFYLARSIARERDISNYRGKGKLNYINLFAGMIYCGDCGKTMTARKYDDTQKVYVCRTYNDFGKGFCNYNRIIEGHLEQLVKHYLKQCRQSLEDNIKKLDKSIQDELSKLYGDDAVILYEDLKKKLEDSNNELKELITQKTKEVIKNPSMSEIIEQTYQELINDKMKRIQSLKTQLEEQKDFNESAKSVQKNLTTALGIFDEIIASDKLTKKQVSMLIERINIYHNKGIEIIMRGDLNSVIEPKMEVIVHKEHIYLKEVVDEIFERKEFFKKHVFNALKEKGWTYSYLCSFKPILDKLEDLQIIRSGENQKKKTVVITDKQTAYERLEIYTDMDTNPRVCTLSGTFESLLSISKWINDITLGQTGIRMVI